MIEHPKLDQWLNTVSPQLRNEVKVHSTIATIESGSEILREGQYVKVIPLVIEGLIKVYSRHEEKELLLYYIQPDESCIMSFSAGLQNAPSEVFAITEVETTALLIPVQKVNEWITKFPEINNLFFQQYKVRYSDLLQTIHHVLFDKLDTRLLSYLIEKERINKSKPIKISHREIAHDLGTAREVISRVLKKLELEGKIAQKQEGISIV